MGFEKTERIWKNRETYYTNTNGQCSKGSWSGIFAEFFVPVFKINLGRRILIWRRHFPFINWSFSIQPRSISTLVWRAKRDQFILGTKVQSFLGKLELHHQLHCSQNAQDIVERVYFNFLFFIIYSDLLSIDPWPRDFILW